MFTFVSNQFLSMFTFVSNQFLSNYHFHSLGHIFIYNTYFGLHKCLAPFPGIGIVFFSHFCILQSKSFPTTPHTPKSELK